MSIDLVKSDSTERYQPSRKWELQYTYAGRTFGSAIYARDLEEAERLVAPHVRVLGEILEEFPA